MPGTHRQDGRRFLQPHDVCPMRFRVLLVVHEGNQRLALPEPFWMHLLGQETVVTEKEDPLAAGDTSRRSGGYRFAGRHRRPCNDHRHTHLGRSQTLRPF